MPPRGRPELPAPPVEGRRPPLWLVVVLLGVFEIPSVLHVLRGLPNVDITADLFTSLMRSELVAVAVLGLVVLVGRYPRSVGWVPRASRARAVPGIALAMVLTAATLIAFASVHLSWSAGDTTVLVVNVLAIGVVEETLFRGLLWSSLPERWSASRVLLVTSVLFGSWHILNGLVTGNWRAAFVQAAIASVVGLGIGAVRLRTGWLGLSVVLHAAIDGGLAAAGLVIAHDGVTHVSPAMILPLLVYEVLYVTVGITGIVVLIRTFRAERRGRQAQAVAQVLAAAGPPPYASVPSSLPLPVPTAPPGHRH
jgi:uncharacterized protein